MLGVITSRIADQQPLTAGHVGGAVANPSGYCGLMNNPPYPAKKSTPES